MVGITQAKIRPCTAGVNLEVERDHGRNYTGQDVGPTLVA
jgi:hypothetical protein